MGEDLENVSAVVVLQIIDLVLTLYHATQEREGRLWRYFGAIAGVKIPDGFGQFTFFGVLTVSLWIVGFIGITGTMLWHIPLAFGCLGAIIGCRLSDSWFSHILLDNKGYQPNPGRGSVPLYFIEVVALVFVFRLDLLAHPLAALIGFTAGALFFYSVIPVIRKFGPLLFPTIDPWKPGDPQPKW